MSSSSVGSVAAGVSAAAMLSSGCQKILNPADPGLKPIQEMLEQQLPPRTPQGHVSQFLSTQGYREQPAQKPGPMVAVIRKIDMEKLEPVTARLTRINSMLWAN